MLRYIKTFVASLVLAFSFSGAAMAENLVIYSPDSKEFSKLEASGKPYVLDFWASWCSTCKVQSDTLAALQNSDEKYNAIPVVRVDWDDYRRAPITTDLRVPRRSTLILFVNGKEVDRIVADTRTSRIKALLDKAI